MLSMEKSGWHAKHDIIGLDRCAADSLHTGAPNYLHITELIATLAAGLNTRQTRIKRR